MPTFTALATDNFNRSDGELGADWDSGYTDLGALHIQGNIVRPDAANTSSLETYNAISWPDDQYVQFDLLSWENENFAAAVLRAADPATATFYSCMTSEFSGTTFQNAIYKTISGSATELAAETVSAWTTSDVLAGAVIGTTLYMYKSDVEVLTATDAALSSGKGGIELLYFFGGAGGLVYVDNFEGGSAEADTPAANGLHSLLLLGVGR